MKQAMIDALKTILKLTKRGYLDTAELLTLQCTPEQKKIYEEARDEMKRQMTHLRAEIKKLEGK